MDQFFAKRPPNRDPKRKPTPYPFPAFPSIEFIPRKGMAWAPLFHRSADAAMVSAGGVVAGALVAWAKALLVESAVATRTANIIPCPRIVPSMSCDWARGYHRSMRRQASM